MSEWLSRIANEVLIKFLVWLIGAVITAIVAYLVGRVRGKTQAEEQYTRMLDAAPEVYVSKLSDLIERAVNEGPNFAVRNAQAIVAARNVARDSLETISKYLNSTIDRLAEAAAVSSTMLVVRENDARRVANADACWELITVLNAQWPMNREVVKTAVRKILTECGIAIVNPRYRPPPTSAPPTTPPPLRPPPTPNSPPPTASAS